MENKCHIGFNPMFKKPLTEITFENIVGKRRKCWLPAISPFLTIFFHSYISVVRQNAALCGNELNHLNC